MVEKTEIENRLIPLDPAADEAMLVAKFEKDTDKTLYPAQSERIMISIIAYMANVVLARVRSALAMFFAQYATLFFLKLWGQFVGCEQLPAQQARDILEVKLYEAYITDKILPKGSKIHTKDGEYTFLTDEDLIIPAGEIKGQVGITSELAGAVLNGYAAGEINDLIENYEYIESVTNLNGAAGGDDEEDAERYRKRVLLAPEKFSNAGSTGAYEYLVLSSHPSILDAKITSSSPGVVDIYVLLKEGLNAESIINTIKEKVSADDKRPLTDKNIYHNAEAINYTYNAAVTIANEADFNTVQINVNNALDKYFTQFKTKLNLEIVPSDIIALIKGIKGVYDVVPADLDIKPANIGKYYNCTRGNIIFKRRVA